MGKTRSLVWRTFTAARRKNGGKVVGKGDRASGEGKLKQQ